MTRRQLLASLALALTSAAWPSPAAAGGEDAVTFSRDVAPILFKHCVQCHRPTMFAPMSLMSFDDARPWARAIKRSVSARTMPPWGADPAYGKFRNDPRLADWEIKTIVSWVDGGAPKGKDADLPKAPAFNDGWSIGQPDVVLSVHEPFVVPATGVIPYQYLRIPANFAEDRWIQAIEIRPGARAQVHHAVAFAQPADEPLHRHEVLGPGTIVIGTPNKTGVVFPKGIARLLRARSDIVLQMHYTATGEAALDRTAIGVIFAKERPTKQPINGSVANSQFVIPAGAANHEVRASRKLEADTLLTSLTPHMHVRGKDMTYIARFPDGGTETLLSVPRYDFNWQITYQLTEPRLLPAGTEIEVIAHFDNSTNNRFNPDPAQNVRWGDQSWEEMMIGFWGTVVDRAPASKR